MTHRTLTSWGFFLAVCASCVATLALGGCGAVTKDLSAAGRGPGIYVCAGKGTISAVGQVAIYGANGAITFDCGSGAYFGQGYPADSLPTMKAAGQPNIDKFPPLGPPPLQVTSP